MFFLSLGANKFYTAYYSKLQQSPRIFNITPDWGIQAMEITIEGKNFGPTWKPGRVFVDGVNFNIKYWSEDKIIAEQPVPWKIFKGEMQVEKADGKKSNEIGYSVRDPATLHR